MLVSVYGSSVFGVEANLITIEVNIGKGIGYHLVGLPDNAVKESNFRIAAALTRAHRVFLLIPIPNWDLLHLKCSVI